MTDLAWQADALCAEPAYQDLPWFPEQGEDVRATKAVCARCPVREECLGYALAHHLDHGTWGGITGRRREEMRRGLVVSSGRRL